MQILQKKTALKIMLGLLTIVLSFHLAILLELVPYGIVWAGKIHSIEEMRVFETISILINLLLIIVLLIKLKNINNNVSSKLINVIIWFFVFFFALNTIGNFFSESWVELIFGTSLTLMSSLLCWIIVKKDNNERTLSE